MSGSDDAPRGVAYDLHVLVARLDRSADRVLRAEFDIGYPRYLVLLTLRRTGPLSQRALADELGVTEPTVSRTLASMSGNGLVEVGSTPGTGNRRVVALTPEGRSFVDKAAARLEDAFASLVEASRIDRQTLADAVGRLLTTLGPDR